MEEWIKCNIGDVCNTISDTYRGDSDEVVLVNTSDVLDGKCMNHQKSPNKDLKGQFKKAFQRDDILYSEIRPANKRFAYIDFDGTDYIASTKLMVIRHKENIIPQFLYYIITSQAVIEELQMLAESRSGTFPQITFTELANQPIELPPLSEQAKIVRFLKSLDDKIEVNRRINDNFYIAFLEVMLIWTLTSLENDNLEQQAQALFKSWFVDFEPFRDQPFVESELGMIPEGWRVGTIGELLEIKYGKDHKKLSDGEIPVYGSGGLMRKCECALYDGESVLIPRKGTLNNVMYVNEAFWTVDTMFYSIPKIDNVVLFTYLYLSGKDLASMNSGSAVPSMTTEILNNMLIVIPTEMVIRDFNITVTSIYSRIKHGNEESRRLAQLRDTLLPRLMSGELKVNDLNTIK